MHEYQSETAQKYAKKVSDHHKGWTLCRIAKTAITRELLVPFVRQEITKEHPDLTPKAFLKFIMQAQNPNYLFLAEYTFEFLDAIFMYRAGVSGGIERFVHAGRAKFAKLWCGRNHPVYRELEASDSLLLQRLPEELKSLVLHATSMYISGRPFTAEGADFRLEEINQQIHHWIPNILGMKDWKIVCCNFDRLAALCANVWEQAGITDPKWKTSKYPQNIDDEVMAFRTELRAAEYLMHPNSDQAHKSLDGELLDADLKNFSQRSREKREEYIKHYMEYETSASVHKPHPPSVKIAPVFVSSAERHQYNAIQNRTVADLKRIIASEMETLSDPDIREALQMTWADIQRKANKSVLLDFYLELQVYRNDQDLPPDNDFEHL